jgi:hypothetical protein
MGKFASQSEFTTADEYPLQPEPAGNYKTETYNQWVYDPAHRIGLNVWFASGQNGGGKPFPEFMATVIVFVDGATYIGSSEGHGNHPEGVAAGNAFLTITEPYKRLQIDYLGLLKRSAGIQKGGSVDDALEPQLSTMNLAVEIVSPPIEQGSQGVRGEVASSGTLPRSALRYEQLCRITGTIRIGSRMLQLDALGMRSHRRNSASIYDSGAVGHTWATALFPSGCGFHLLSYQIEPKGAVGFLYGHYFDGEQYREAKVIRFPYFTGVCATEQSRLELLVDGRRIEIDVDSYAPLVNMPAKGPRVSRSAARFRMDGEIGGGLLERSLKPEYLSGGEYLDQSGY